MSRGEPEGSSRRKNTRCCVVIIVKQYKRKQYKNSSVVSYDKIFPRKNSLSVRATLPYFYFFPNQYLCFRRINIGNTFVVIIIVRDLPREKKYASKSNGVRVLHPSCKYSLSTKFFKKSLFLTLYFLPFYNCNSTKNLNFVSNFCSKLCLKKYAYISMPLASI